MKQQNSFVILYVKPTTVLLRYPGKPPTHQLKQVGSQPHLRGSTWASRAYKYSTRVEVTESDKHSSLLWYRFKAKQQNSFAGLYAKPASVLQRDWCKPPTQQLKHVGSQPHLRGSTRASFAGLQGWKQAILKGEVSLYHRPPVWLV